MPSDLNYYHVFICPYQVVVLVLVTLDPQGLLAVAGTWVHMIVDHYFPAFSSCGNKIRFEPRHLVLGLGAMCQSVSDIVVKCVQGKNSDLRGDINSVVATIHNRSLNTGLEVNISKHLLEPQVIN